MQWQQTKDTQVLQPQQSQSYETAAACLVMIHVKYVHRNHLNIQFEEYITHALSVSGRFSISLAMER